MAAEKKKRRQVATKPSKGGLPKKLSQKLPRARREFLSDHRNFIFMVRP